MSKKRNKQKSDPRPSVITNTESSTDNSKLDNNISIAANGINKSRRSPNLIRWSILLTLLVILSALVYWSLLPCPTQISTSLIETSTVNLKYDSSLEESYSPACG